MAYLVEKAESTGRHLVNGSFRESQESRSSDDELSIEAPSAAVASSGQRSADSYVCDGEADCECFRMSMRR